MQFLESIKILDGCVYLEELHLQRINKTLQAHYYNDFIAWKNLPIKTNKLPKKGLYKCRIVYDNLKFEIELIPYAKKIYTKYSFVEAPEIIYNYKFENRIALNKHKKEVANDCEIIFTNNNLITDAFYSNVCLWNGQEWHTPAKPMLEGVMRKNLLAKNKIIEKNIEASQIKKYKKISFINALNDLDENIIIL